MSKATEKRQALGDKYIGKHGTNTLKGSARGRHNKKKLQKLNEQHKATWRTLTQARVQIRAQRQAKAGTTKAE